jgi:AcrR family transcriptional regulator
VAASEPAYTRLQVDERRRQLLDLGADLFARFAYDELSMARIAREAGISKALLYHYFPSKQAYFAATLEQAAAELAATVEPNPELPPVEQLAGSLDAYLSWVERNADAYAKLIMSVGAVPEVRELVERVRDETADRILAGISPTGAAPPLRAAVRGWLWFLDGAILDWIRNRDIERSRLHGLLLGTLLGAVTASGEPLPITG